MHSISDYRHGNNLHSYKIRFFPTTYAEILFLMILMAIGLLPIPNTELFGIPISLRELIIPVSSFVLLPVLLTKRENNKSAFFVFVCFLFIAMWALFSMTWSDVFLKEDQYFVLLMTISTIFLAYIASNMTFRVNIKWENVVTRLALFLTFIFFVYGVNNLLGTDTTNTLGINRLKGYLGGAAVIHIIMLPVIAVHLANIRNKRNPHGISTIALILTVFSVFLTGSRAGVATMILMFLIIALRKLSLKKIIILISSSAIGYLILNSFMDLSRFTNFSDPARSATNENGMSIVFQDLQSFLFGQGFGDVWSWYRAEMLGYIHFGNNFDGYTLFHPHSLFLQIFVELGFVSLIPFLFILGVIIRKFFSLSKMSSTLQIYLLIAIVCTLPSTFTDLYIFRNWESSFIWLTFLFIALRNEPSKPIKRAA